MRKSNKSGGRSLFGITTAANGKVIIKTKEITVYMNVPVPYPVEMPFDLSQNVIDVLNEIDTRYTSNIANQQYQLIPSDLERYLVLHNTIYDTQTRQTNTNIVKLFKITNDGLHGSINAYALYTSNVQLSLNNILLQKKIDEIMSGKNEQQAMSNTTGQFTATQTFVLAPLFSYYIIMYGMPAYGVGFDPVKLSIITNILIDNGIDPYA
jgi:hypothetical protein